MDGYAILVILAIAWLWYTTMQAREVALGVVRRTCQDMELQWLDEMVSVTSLGLQRDPTGRLRLRRIYGFRYLDADESICIGLVILLGSQVHTVLLDAQGRAN